MDENKPKLQMWNPSKAITQIVQNKNFSQKESLLKRLYNLRIKYGNLERTGLIQENSDVLKVLRNNKFPFKSFLSNKRERPVDSDEPNKFNSLIYDCNLNIDIQESRREMNLRELLDVKLNKLNNLLSELDK